MTHSPSEAPFRLPGVRPAGLLWLDRLAGHVPGVLCMAPLVFFCCDVPLAWALLAVPAFILYQLQRRTDGWIAIESGTLIEVLHGPLGARERVVARLDAVRAVEQVVWLQDREGAPAVPEEGVSERTAETHVVLHLRDAAEPVLLGTLQTPGENLDALGIPVSIVHCRRTLRAALVDAMVALLAGALYTWPVGIGALFMMPRAHRILAASAQDSEELAENDPRAFMIGTLAPVVGLAAWCLFVPFLPEMASPGVARAVAGTMVASLLINAAFQVLACRFLVIRNGQDLTEDATLGQEKESPSCVSRPLSERPTAVP
jgi:hypothetical protein